MHQYRMRQIVHGDLVTLGGTLIAAIWQQHSGNTWQYLGAIVDFKFSISSASTTWSFMSCNVLYSNQTKQNETNNYRETVLCHWHVFVSCRYENNWNRWAEVTQTEPLTGWRGIEWMNESTKNLVVQKYNTHTTHWFNFINVLQFFPSFLWHEHKHNA